MYFIRIISVRQVSSTINEVCVYLASKPSAFLRKNLPERIFPRKSDYFLETRGGTLFIQKTLLFTASRINLAEASASDVFELGNEKLFRCDLYKPEWKA